MTKTILKSLKRDYERFLSTLENHDLKNREHTKWYVSPEKERIEDLEEEIKNLPKKKKQIFSERCDWTRDPEAVFDFQNKKWYKESVGSETSESPDGKGKRTEDFHRYEECKYHPSDSEKEKIEKIIKENEKVQEKKEKLVGELKKLKKENPEPTVPLRPELKPSGKWKNAFWFFNTAKKMGLTLKKKRPTPFEQCGSEMVDTMDRKHFNDVCRQLKI